MDCPRCGAPITEYTLDGQTTVECTACGWLGVDVEHRAERESEESWEAAYRRFRERDRDRERSERA